MYGQPLSLAAKPHKTSHGSMRKTFEVWRNKMEIFQQRLLVICIANIPLVKPEYNTRN